MQADENLTGEEAEEARKIWLSAAKAAAGFARKLANIGTHKQHANRLLEPFVYYTGVMTSTEWDNFWKLRTHADAQPEFRTLATQMLEIYDASRPKEDKFHLPYTDNCPSYLDYTALFKVAAARCARVSYKTFDGKVSTVDKDIKLCDDLIASGHLSPFDHPGEADSVYYDFVREEVYWANPADHRHNFGWIPHRVSVERQKGMVCARNSYAPLASKFDLTQAGA